jgi:pimeloyl-ACP methyl ester carboxylesterase
MQRKWMKRFVIAVASMLTPFCLGQTQIAGDWEGALHAGGSTLHLVLHIQKAAEGQLKATLDSVDQGANGIPVSAISFKDSRLKLSIAAVGGGYDGVVNADGTEMKGTWTQGTELPLEFRRMVASTVAPVAPSDIDGAWLGSLDTGAIKLRIVFHILNTASGLTATIDSPDQGAMGLPTSVVTRSNNELKIEAKNIGGAYEGVISADRETITGKWTQGGGTLPLVLQRVKTQSELERKRPPNPVRPYPYRDVDVSYENKVQGDTLAATLTIPPGKGPFPAVLLITGSGPQDRDESLLGHKPFLVLADYLTRKGIVVLRADDRGTGKSTGDFSAATTADFVTDTEAGVSYLKTRPEVDARKIGLIGHSEGGEIAPMIAARNPDVAFIVMMAGPGVPGDQVLVGQNILIAEAQGMPVAEAEESAAKKAKLFALVVKESDPALLDKELRDMMSADGVDAAMIGAQVKALTSPWFRYFMAYDPAVALRKVKCPVLALNGEKDLQVSPTQNLPAIRNALAQGGNQKSMVEELPGLNHLFQTAKTGSPSEYAEIEETISPVALETIAGWVLKQ